MLVHSLRREQKRAVAAEAALQRCQREASALRAANSRLTNESRLIRSENQRLAHVVAQQAQQQQMCTSTEQSLLQHICMLECRIAQLETANAANAARVATLENLSISRHAE
eukprot:4911495-Prymnesium_polylepis.1